MTDSEWKGSKNTYEMVREQILDRWGKEAAEEFNPLENCFTFHKWSSMGFTIKKGSKALKSFTYVQGKRSDKDGEEKGYSYRKTVNLFFKTQVKKK